MIVKMTRYSFVFLSGIGDDLLARLRELGLMDITRSSKPVDQTSSELLARAEEIKKRIGDIEGDRFTRDARYNELTSCFENARKAYKERLPWGAFDKAAVDGLQAQGIKLRFYLVSTKKFDASWAEIQPLEVIENDGKSVWFVTLGPVEGYSFPIEECAAPEDSAAVSLQLMEETQAAIEERKAFLSGQKAELPALRKEYDETIESLEMYLAKVGTESAADGMLCVMEGFVPTEDAAGVDKALEGMDGLYYISEEATKEDNPPIKLRNNWFARQFESLTGMYGMPVYDEWDPTPILAPFFLLFFALCMGDAGYGILLIALAYAFRGMKDGGPMGLGNHWRLLRSLGVGTLVVGFFLGTFFGIDLYAATWVPDALKAVMLKGTVAGFDIQMVLSIAIGILHICLAMVVKSLLFTQRFGFKETISTWGWTLLIVGSLVAFGVCTAISVPAAITKWIIVGIGGVSALAIFIFNKIGRNPLVNIGAGLWDTYQVATGLLGDVLSYIRLYALGLAGGMLGGAFNNLAGMLLGDHPTWQYLPFVLVLLLGHALNFAMSGLGAYVHPLRLTFVEYFKNSGFEGKGTEFKPFAKSNNNK